MELIVTAGVRFDGELLVEDLFSSLAKTYGKIKRAARRDRHALVVRVVASAEGRKRLHPQAVPHPSATAGPKSLKFLNDRQSHARGQRIAWLVTLARNRLMSVPTAVFTLGMCQH